MKSIIAPTRHVNSDEHTLFFLLTPLLWVSSLFASPQFPLSMFLFLLWGEVAAGFPCYTSKHALCLASVPAPRMPKRHHGVHSSTLSLVCHLTQTRATPSGSLHKHQALSIA